jgi:hypothetical protein
MSSVIAASNWVSISGICRLAEVSVLAAKRPLVLVFSPPAEAWKDSITLVMATRLVPASADAELSIITTLAAVGGAACNGPSRKVIAALTNHSFVFAYMSIAPCWL